MQYQIRFPYNTALFSKYGPIQHAVNPQTLKSFCGRNAENWGIIDDREIEGERIKYVGCKKCEKSIQQSTRATERE